MAHVMNMKTYGTGVSGDTVGLIVATYPTDATCTATCNGVTLTSHASGRWIFQVPFTGTWTLTSYMPGMESDTKTATITNIGDVVEVRLYAYNLFYRNGNQYVQTTGGWSGEDVTFEETYIDLPIKTSLVNPVAETENEFTIKAMDGISITAEPAEIGKTAYLYLKMVHNGISQFTAGMTFVSSSTHHFRTTRAVTGKIVISGHEDSECDIKVKEVYGLIR